MNTKRGMLLRRIAAALSRQPGQSYQQLAESVGVSRRTLYRVAPSREALMAVLQDEAVAACEWAVFQAGIGHRPALAALEALTAAFLADAELYTFWVADTWSGDIGPQPVSRSDAPLAAYRRTMVAFFEKGQDDGVFRADLPATWLVRVYDALFWAADDAARADAVDPADLTRSVLAVFLAGASAVSGTGRS